MGESVKSGFLSHIRKYSWLTFGTSVDISEPYLFFMIEATPLSVRFTNRLQGYLKAQRILYRQGMMAKVDKGVALFVFGFDLCVVFFVGLRG